MDASELKLEKNASINSWLKQQAGTKKDKV